MYFLQFPMFKFNFPPRLVSAGQNCKCDWQKGTIALELVPVQCRCANFGIFSEHQCDPGHLCPKYKLENETYSKFLKIKIFFEKDRCLGTSEKREKLVNFQNF